MRDLLHGPSRAGAELAGRPAHGDHRQRFEVVRHAEEFADFGLMGAVERGQRGAEAKGAGGEHQVLHGGEDVRADARDCRRTGRLHAGEDQHGHTGDVVRQVCGRANRPAGGRIRWDRRRVYAVHLVPAVEIPLADFRLLRRVSDDDKCPRLEVAAAGRSDGGVQYFPDQLFVYWIGLQAAHRPLREHRFENVHWFLPRRDSLARFTSGLTACRFTLILVHSSHRQR